MIDWTHWHNEPFLIGGLIFLGWLYTILAGPWRERLAPGTPYPRGPALKFYAALLCFYLGVGSPLDQIAERSQLHANTISASLLLLERAGYISILARGLHRSRVRVIASKEELRNFVDQNPKHDDFLRSLFRLYGSIWDFAVPISEYQLSVLNERSKNEVLTSLNDLHKLQILEYLPASSTSQFSYAKQRVDTSELSFPETMYEERRDIDLAKLNSMQHLLSEDHCREQYILRYFGEDADTCGKCDYCQRERALPTTKEILNACLTGKTLDELYAWPVPFNKEKIIELVQEALAEGWLIPKEGKYFTAK